MTHATVPHEPATNPSGASLVVVGEAPGRQEALAGKPFVGPSGHLMMKGIATLGLERGDVHWTNAVERTDCKNKRELQIARSAEQARLTAELAHVKWVPHAIPIVLSVGALGTQSALGRGTACSILAWRGAVIPRRLNGGNTTAYIMPSVHPAFVLRSQAWGPVFELDFARVGRVMRDGWTPPEQQPGRQTVVTKTETELRDYLPRLGSEVGYDVETVGLGAVETKLVCLALSDTRLTVVVPWSTAFDGSGDWWPNPERIAELLTDTLRTRIAVSHNGPFFDHVVGNRYGIRATAWEDTLLAYHALAPHMPKNLHHVVTQYLDVTAWKQLDHSKQLEDLWVYNGRDALYTILAWTEMKGRVIADG